MQRTTSGPFFVILACLLCFPGSLWARLQPPEGSEDIRQLGALSTFIFHAQVLSIATVEGTDTISGQTVPEVKIATLLVDRWYQGTPEPSTVRLKYIYPGFMGGRNCIDLQRTSSWLIFANRTSGGTFEFSEDCEGGLPMSSILASGKEGPWLEALQKDLIAGLQDGDPGVRLANIARLGGLKLRSSGDALREVIEHGSELESQWAVYAALRSGDPSVLPRIERIVLNFDPVRNSPAEGHPNESVSTEGAAPRCSIEGLQINLRYAIGELQSPEAIPALGRIARLANEEYVRDRALNALHDIRDPSSLPALFDLLSETDQNLRSEALYAIVNITEEPECQQDEGEGLSIEACERWWARDGRFFKWPSPGGENE